MPSRLDEIRERLAAVTPGPWKHGPESHGVYRPSNPRGKPIVDEAATPEDADFIAHAPTDIAHLLGLLEKLKPHLGTAVEACKCREHTHNIRGQHEHEKTTAEARAALEELMEALR